jgi:outer membrane protein OmpA-like peptidoglycan-associated protein
VFGVGGAISLARFYAAGLPADQALDAATETDVRAVGLTWIVLLAVLGVVAVILAYFASPEGRATASMYYLLIAIAAVEAVVVWGVALHRQLWDKLDAQEIKALFVIGFATVGAWVLIYVLQRENPERTGQAPSLKLTAKTQAQKGKANDPTLVIPLWGYVLLGLISVVAGVAVGHLLGPWWVWVSTIFAGVLGLVTIRVADMSGARFRWYGVCVFFSVVLFGSVLGVLRTFADPRLQPVAFLLSDGDRVSAMQGIYVGQSDDRLWFASVELKRCGRDAIRRGSGRLRSVPSDHASYVTIGPGMRPPRLARESQAMLDEIRAEHAGREVVVGTPAIRDAVAITALGRTRREAGRWVRIGSSRRLGARPKATLKGRRLRLRRDPHDPRRWEARLARTAAAGPVYVDCGERTNPAFVTVPKPPLATATAVKAPDGGWVLDARGSADPDGQIDRYAWKVGKRKTLSGRRVHLTRRGAPTSATLIVEDGDGLEDDRTVALDARVAGRYPSVARTYPSDLLFCFDCRRLSRAGARHVRAMRDDIRGAKLVKIRVHTDARGSDRHNRALAKSRATRVEKALVGRMKSPPRMRVVGVGEREPESRGDHRQNRRIEILIYRQRSKS